MRWVKELGSGKMNIKKYAPLYYNKFKIDILNAEKFVFSITYRNVVEDGGINRVVGGINVEDGGIKFLISNIKHIKATTKLELVKVALLVQEFGGIRSTAIGEKLNYPQRTVERYLNILSTSGVIEFRGALKTGGYFLKEIKATE